MKIVIVGPGAIGCLFGGLLARAGEEVVLLDHRPERAQQIMQSGLRVKDYEGEFTVQIAATADASEIGVADLVIICVKAYDTTDAARWVAPCVGQDTTVLTLQNGLGNVEKLAKVFGEEHVVGGMTGHGATLLDTGYVQHTGIGDTAIGMMLPEVPKINIKATFDNAGIATCITDNLAGAIWGKVVINCAINPLAALTRLRNGELLHIPALSNLLGRAAEEAAHVAIASGVILPYSDAAEQTKKVCERTAENINSMLADVLKGRRTEINEINGAVVREGKNLNLTTTLNTVLLNLVLGLEKKSL